MDFSELTVEELQAKFVDDGLQLTILENRRQALLAEMAKRQRQVAAKAGVSGMTEDQKEALRIELGPSPGVVQAAVNEAMLSKTKTVKL